MSCNCREPEDLTNYNPETCSCGHCGAPISKYTENCTFCLSPISLVKKEVEFNYNSEYSKAWSEHKFFMGGILIKDPTRNLTFIYS